MQFLCFCYFRLWIVNIVYVYSGWEKVVEHSSWLAFRWTVFLPLQLFYWTYNSANEIWIMMLKFVKQNFYEKRRWTNFCAHYFIKCLQQFIRSTNYSDIKRNKNWIINQKTHSVLRELEFQITFHKDIV